MLKRVDGTARLEPSLEMAHGVATTRQYHAPAHHSCTPRRRVVYRYHLHLEARVRP
jgi:hypothetical protein